MIKVLIVDDEFYSRKGIRKLIPWQNFKCEVCGEADNAYDAIDKALIDKPNIIITDINMPEMNGLEMAKKIKDKEPNTKFIVITGYDDFNYARGAVKINAVDFLLKPVDIDELKEALSKCVDSILKDDEIAMMAKEKKLIGILRGEEEIDKINDFFSEHEKVSIALINNDYFQENLKNCDEDKCIKVNLFIKEWINKNIKQHYYNIYQVHRYRSIVILKEIIEDDLEKLILDVKKHFNCELTISVTGIQNAIRIRELYEEAKELLDESFYIGKGKVIKNKLARFNLKYDIKYIEKLGKDSIELILNGESLKAQKNYDKIFKYFIENRIEKRIITSFILRTITKLKYDFKELDIPLNDINEVDMMLEFSSIDKFKTEFLEKIKIFIYNFREYKGNLEENSMKRAIIYIKNNYNNNISLNDVAKEVYLNKSYLSRAIKQNLGMGFTEYIRKLRIEKSIELLKKGNTIVSIAKEVGYGDYRQFTLNFKKYTGHTPSNYNFKNKIT